MEVCRGALTLRAKIWPHEGYNFDKITNSHFVNESYMFMGIFPTSIGDRMLRDALCEEVIVVLGAG